MAEKKSRTTESKKSGKKASGKAANTSKAVSTKNEAKAAGVKKNPAGSRTADSITAVIFIAVSIFTIIALLTEKTGQIGMILSLFLKGMLGLVAYILPFYLIIYSVLMLARRVAHANSRTILFTVILICDIAMLNSVRFEHIRSSEFFPNYMVDMFQEGTNLDSAGLIGMTLGRLACQLVEIPGLIITGIVVLIICVILVADTPISQFFDQLRIRRNQKKINALSLKTESGIYDSKADTQPIPVITDQQIAAAGQGKGSSGTGNKKAAGNASRASVSSRQTETAEAQGNTGRSASRSPSSPAAGQAESFSSASLSVPSGTVGEYGRERSGRFRVPAFLSSIYWRKTEEDTIPVNKRQILNYMNDNSLFQEESDFEDDSGIERGLGESYGDSLDYINSLSGSVKTEVPYPGRQDRDFFKDFPSFDEESEKESKAPSASVNRKDKKTGRSGQAAGEGASSRDPIEAELDALFGNEPEEGKTKAPGDSQYSEKVNAEAGPDLTVSPDRSRENYGRTNRSRSSESAETETDGDMTSAAAGQTGSAVSSAMSPAAKKAAVAAAAESSLEEVSKEAENASATPEKTYVLPPLYLLEEPRRHFSGGQAELREKAAVLEKVLQDFGVEARVINVNRGPSITRYEIQPATGVKVNSIVRLSDDIALNLRAKSLRIEAPIPGKAAIGIEVQNDRSEIVSIREMIESDAFQTAESKISFSVGEDITGNAVIADLKKMPHMLIAGSTGSGKSVCINSILISMLYRSTPDEVKFILIDPKVVELGNYNGIPHMLIPVVTDPAKAAAALMWAVHEMEGRYKKFAKENVKNLAGYNTKMRKEDRPEEVMPQIVIVIDELADLMMAAAKQVEESICRLAQLARAAGMHLIVATQRPSVDVVTGLIKANVPSRIAFAVSSQVDSRTILDRAGAEKLVGNGDMLFSPLGSSHPQRLQGPFVTDDEVAAVIDFWKEQAGDDAAPEEIRQQVMQEINTVNTDFNSGIDGEEEDELYEDAVQLVVDSGQASASMLQRRFRIGYNRAGRLIDTMEARGIIGPSEGSRPRKVLISREEYEAENYMAEEVEILEEESVIDTSMSAEDES